MHDQSVTRGFEYKNTRWEKAVNLHLKQKSLNNPFTFTASGTPVALKMGQGHQNWYEQVKLMRGSWEKFETSPRNANIKVLAKYENMSTISL